MKDIEDIAEMLKLIYMQVSMHALSCHKKRKYCTLIGEKVQKYIGKFELICNKFSYL